MREEYLLEAIDWSTPRNIAVITVPGAQNPNMLRSDMAETNESQKENSTGTSVHGFVPLPNSGC